MTGYHSAGTGLGVLQPLSGRYLCSAFVATMYDMAPHAHSVVSSREFLMPRMPRRQFTVSWVRDSAGDRQVHGGQGRGAPAQHLPNTRSTPAR
jgi:hypothetical protein